MSRRAVERTEHPSRAPTTTKRLLAALEDLIGERRRVLADQGRRLELGDVQALAERMLAALPNVHPLDAPLGPFYDTAGLVAWLGVSRQALFDRVQRGTILACRTADGHLVYPSLQFGRDGTVRPGVSDAVRAMARQGVDGWTVGAWLTTESAAFDGQSAVDYLVVHRSSPAAVAHVADVAAGDAAALAA